MQQSKFEWRQREKKGSISPELIKQFSLDPLEVTILENRGILTEEQLNRIMNPKFYDSECLYNIEEIIEVIQYHVDTQSDILIYGDFDADGIISTTLLYKNLRTLTDHVSYFIPNRLEEGYGPSEVGLQKSEAFDKNLVIFVDNGVAAIDEIEELRMSDIDVIVIDHHQFKDVLPNAHILHPAHPEGDYPFQQLCAAAVVYKLLDAMNLANDDDLMLAGIATVTDLVPMIDENKAFVKAAIKLLNQSAHRSIAQLLKASGHSGVIDEEIIGYSIGPRLNATGRLGAAEIGVELLLETDTSQLTEYAIEIEETNKQRKHLVEEISAEAMNAVDASDDILVVYNDAWHHGVLGIVASKISEHFGKPAIVLSLKDDVYVGSGRSIEGFNLYEQINQVKDLLVHFGGHEQALGVSVHQGEIESFKSTLNDHVAKLYLKLKPLKMIDIKLNSELVTLKTYEKFLRLKPFGQGFGIPIVLAHDVKIGEIKRVGKDRSHIKMQFPELNMGVIGFGFGDLKDELSVHDTAHFIGTLNINHFNQNRTLQMNLLDSRIDHVQIIDMRAKHNQNFDMIDKEEAVFLIDVDKKKLGDNYYYYGEKIPFTLNTLVLRDLPSDLDALEQSLRGCYVSKLVVLFHQQTELYFTGLPTEAKIIEVDEIIGNAKDGSIDLKVHAPHLAKRVDVSMKEIKMIIDILEDLKRIHLAHAIINLGDRQTLLDINDSILYNKLVRQLHSESQLKMITSEELKTYLRELLQVR